MRLKLTPPRNDERAPQFGLQARAPVKEAARPRVKPRRRRGVQAGDEAGRDVGGTLVGRDELNTRTKTPIPKTLTARQAAFEEPNDACAPTAGAQEKRPRTAVGKTHQR